jgi:hypothetical protein
MWRSCDDGFAAPACVLWFAHDKIYDRIYVVNEIYARGLIPMSLAQATLAIDRQYGAHRQTQGIIDSASFADIGMGGGRANTMNAMGTRWQPSEKGRVCPTRSPTPKT